MDKKIATPEEAATTGKARRKYNTTGKTYCVYVAHFARSLNKIGYSSSPEARIRHLGNLFGKQPDKYQVFTVCDMTTGRLAERAVFERLKGSRIGKGEFVTCTYAEAIKAVKAVLREVCGADHAS